MLCCTASFSVVFACCSVLMSAVSEVERRPSLSLVATLLDRKSICTDWKRDSESLEREHVTAVLVCLCINYIAVLLKQTWAPDWLQPLQLLGLHLWCCLIWTLRPPADASDWLNPVLPLQSDSGVLLPSEALHQLQFSRLIKNNLFAVGNGVFVVSLINVSLSIHYSSFLYSVVIYLECCFEVWWCPPIGARLGKSCCLWTRPLSGHR